MYLVTPFPNVLYALDLERGGPVRWKYEPRPLPALQGVACCDVVNRGAAYEAGRVFFNTLDNQVVAVDGATGRELWKTRVGDINQGETMTMGHGQSGAAESRATSGRQQVDLRPVRAPSGHG